MGDERVRAYFDLDAYIADHPARAALAYSVLEFSLAVAETGKRYPLKGNALSFLQSSSNNAEVTVKMGGFNKDGVLMSPGDMWKHDYTEFWLSWEAQPGRTAILISDWTV